MERQWEPCCYSFSLPQARCPIRGDALGVCDSFQSEAAPKIVPTSASSQGKREAQAALTPPGLCCLWCPGTRDAASSWGSFVAFRSPWGDTNRGVCAQSSGFGQCPRSHRQQRAVPHRRSATALEEGIFLSGIEETEQSRGKQPNTQGVWW